MPAAGSANVMPDPLDALPVEGGFRQRGLQMTRIEAFTDAAFAFALTLLVISFDQVPSSMEELRSALKNIPAFAASFAQIAMFWYAHHRWSRRYGLDDLMTALLSLSLVFVTLIFVFPLRVVFSGLFAWLTDGWLPFQLVQYSPGVIGDVFIIYGAGFVAMSAVIVLHYWHAHAQAEVLALNAVERFITRSEMQAWLILSATGAASTLVALTAPPQWRPLAGMVYALLAVVMPLFGMLKSRQFRRLTADQ